MSDQFPAAETVMLDDAITRQDQAITSIAIRRPIVPDLLGLSMRDIMDLDAGTMVKMIPRITNPALTEAELLRMNAADFFALSVEVSGFFLPKALRPVSPAQ